MKTRFGTKKAGKAFAARRKALGLNQRELSVLLGLHYSMVSLIETGHRAATEETLRRLELVEGGLA